MLIEWLSFVLIGVAALAIAAAPGTPAELRTIRNLLVAGVFMRIVGVLARYSMIFDLYDGGSDAVGYFQTGSIIADHFRALDFSIIGSGQFGQREWGTQAVRYASGVVQTFIGPSMRGAFLVFSLAAFLGLVCITVAFGRSSRSSSMQQAALLLFFWPTLWFWPSSIGKEATLLLAIGLVMLGYVGRGERIHWIPLAGGFALALAVRPHLAGVLAISACVAEWTSRGWTPRRVAQSLVASAGALWLTIRALELLGLSGTDLASMQEFVAYTGQQTYQGGSAFDRPTMAAAIPMSFINILCRPFITEANNGMALASSLEMMALWAIALLNLRNLKSVLQSWRSNRLLRFAIPFALLYILMIGLTFQNFGIIARQRTLVMPALLLLFAAKPVVAMRRARTVPTRRVWRNHESTARPLAVRRMS
ncbi:MAG: hypothetical protein EHM55_02095 [Acidobacteria bacterium]|nr:MAG: hypothetical protein EHM55_02095 [Acidobacteriota bacterium]